MSYSFISRRFHTFMNSITHHQRIIIIKRMQQTNAALNSTTETHQFSNDVIPVFKYAAQFNDRTALRDMHGDYTYRGLFLSARQFAIELNELLGEGSQERIAFLLPNDASYIITQWACWISGQIAVPLNDQHPAPVLNYYVTDSDAKVFITTQEHLPIVEPFIAKSKRRLIVFDNALRILAMKTDNKIANNKSTFQSDFGNSLDAGVPGDFYNKSDAMFVYTSGTTSKPKEQEHQYAAKRTTITVVFQESDAVEEVNPSIAEVNVDAPRDAHCSQQIDSSIREKDFDLALCSAVKNYSNIYQCSLKRTGPSSEEDWVMVSEKVRKSGVVLSHKNIQAQVNALLTAWKHTEKDIFLHALPLHHVHGIVQVLICPLYVGGRCVMLPKFSASGVWAQITAVNLHNSERINVFSAVPTIYMKLIEEYDLLFANNEKIKGYIHNVCINKIRLMISGSAPLPKPIFDRWEEITGHRLLERYGMTETGMTLSNPLEGQRVPGTVGTPLPGIEVRLTVPQSLDNENSDSEVIVYGNSKSSQVLTKSKSTLSGDLQVKGESVFKRYWNRPEVTKNSFTKDGWFKTGDTVQYNNGIYKILGRSSVDIIKSGGYKISAVEVETVILGHPDIIDCTVVGVEDLTWGQKVAAIVVLAEGSEIVLSQLRDFAKKTLPSYAVPTVLKVVNKVPKNSMGKVNKPDIIRLLFEKKDKS